MTNGFQQVLDHIRSIADSESKKVHLSVKTVEIVRELPEPFGNGP